MADSGAISGITGAITSWAGTDHGALLTGQRPFNATLNYTADDVDTTAFADGGIETHIPGLTGWSVTWTAQLATPAIGAMGLVTFSGGYVSNLNAWTLNAVQAALEVPEFGTALKTFIPGLISWGGSFGGWLDGTTPAVAPGAAAAAAVFRYQDLATDAELAGNIFATQLGLSAAPSAANTINYSYRGTAGLTSTGTAKALNSLAATTPSSLVFTASTGRTFTGSAFWSSIGVSVNASQATTVTVTAQGTGALSIA